MGGSLASELNKKKETLFVMEKKLIKAIIGLGNPGRRFDGTRHNIGFAIVDQLAKSYHGSWHQKDMMEIAEIAINNQPVLLIKPQTYMNNSGQIMLALKKKGVGPEHILVIHDELEKPFGTIALKEGGSHRGHNGLRSIIETSGPDFLRLRFGIGRPEHKDDVADYVLERFTSQEQTDLSSALNHAIEIIENQFH